ncbi:hypothetical protein [Sandaracinus amylolyticus]|uniref:hypothetical protein n=1 Tax=Sandaracinus amylolyticus TaxID=927083 RepID=UPI001F367B51|nr:hypothetical protein [Sandaracinus amylolyticus]
MLHVLLALVAGCGLPLDTDQRVPTFPIFDPGSGEIPMPNDALRDDEEGHLDLPIDDDDPDLSVTERAFRSWMNTRDGWSTTMAATVRFSAVVDDRSIDPDTVQVWDWLPTPQRVNDLEMRLEEGDRRLTILAPRTGWERGHRYVIVVRGGELGVRDTQGFGVEPDAIFYFLRRNEVLNTIGHNRAFPGPTRAERLDAGTRLENLRLELAPFFQFFEDPARPTQSEIPRDEVAALWSFTVTQDPELAMDRDSQRVPLPFDLLIDPDTGLVSLEEAEWDSELEANAKRQANELDGFGVSPNLLFELTEAVDPATVAGNVHLFELDDTPRELPVSVKVMGDDGEEACRQTPTPADCIHLVVVVDDSALPLQGHTTHAVVVDRGIRSADGEAVEPMPIGWFMRSEHPIAVRGESQIGSLTDALANRVEITRARIGEFLDGYGRENLITAWPFTTMDAVPGIREAARTSIDLELDVEPTVRERLTPAQALEALSPGVEGAAIRAVYLTRSIGVREYVVGTIPSPYFLDPISRRWRDDGQHPMQPVRFYMAIPNDLPEDEPAPVVIFGHAIVTDSRFLMGIAGELAQRGFVAIAIDFPFHGERIACIDASLVAIPNFFPEVFRNLTGLDDDILRFPPCASGGDATCSTDGRCLTASGEPDEFNQFPLVAVQMASGAAFLDTHDLPYINDHFRQALIDLSSLLRSIQTADWEGATGVRLDPERVHYVGQSLGAIIGSVWVSVTPEIQRAVLNVPGSDMVDLFVESTYFSPQIDEYFTTIDVPRPSFEEERLLDVARWLIDGVDPHSVAHLYAQEDRQVLIQMSRGDIIIPNRTTEVFRRVSGRPMRTYASPLHADLIIPALGDAMLRDLGMFISGEIEE